MRSNMNPAIKYISILIVIGLMLGFSVSIANASIFDWFNSLFNSSEELTLGAPSLGTFHKDLFPLSNNTYVLGTSTRQWLRVTSQNASTTNFTATNAWITNQTIDALTISSLAVSPFVVGGTATTTIYGNGSVSTFGGGATFNGVLTATSSVYLATVGGNVGIASSSPLSVLSINVSNNNGVNQALNITNATGSLMFVRSDGNIGFRSTNPLSVLDIQDPAGEEALILRAPGSGTQDAMQVINNAAATLHQLRMDGLYVNTGGFKATGQASFAGSGTGLEFSYDGVSGHFRVHDRVLSDWLPFQINDAIHVSGDNGGSVKVGIGTAGTAPTQMLTMEGNAARTFLVERHTSADTAGNNLPVQSGGATSAATDKAGGELRLSSGISTGTGGSFATIYTFPAGASGTADNTATERLRGGRAGNVGIGTTTPSSLLTVSAANATTTISFGGSAVKKGTCLEMYDVDGNPQYVRIQGGAFIINTQSCK